MKKSKAIPHLMISGYYGFKNTGDEAILAAMINSIRTRLPKIEITVLSNIPRETSRIYSVKSIHRMHWFKIIRKLINTDIFISGGGGLLQDSTGRGLSILYYLGLILLAKIFSVPVMMYAQGIGPVKRSFNKLIIKWILGRVDLLTVRDIQSSGLLKKLNMKKPRIHVNADPTFLLDEARLKNILQQNPSLKNFMDKDQFPLVGISVRKCQGKNEELKRNFAQIANFLIKKYNTKIILIPFHANEDTFLSEEIIDLVDMKQNTYLLKEEFKPEELLAVMSSFSFMVGIRLHSLIFSCLMHVPFIAVSYDPKIENFVKNLTLPELLLDVNSVSLKSVQKKVEYIIENKEKIENILIKKAKFFKEKANSNNDLFFELLNDRLGGTF